MSIHVRSLTCFNTRVLSAALIKVDEKWYFTVGALEVQRLLCCWLLWDMLYYSAFNSTYRPPCAESKCSISTEVNKSQTQNK